jgi:hypothetical protein
MIRCPFDCVFSYPFGDLVYRWCRPPYGTHRPRGTYERYAYDTGWESWHLGEDGKWVRDTAPAPTLPAVPATTPPDAETK